MTADRLALIPARGGSRRIPRKNFKPLAGKPLMAWTIEAALTSELFDPEHIHVCSDDEQARRIAETYGVSFIDQQHPLHRDECRDVEIVLDVIERLGLTNEDIYYLRPTSPFRDHHVIRAAHERWLQLRDQYDSMRAIRPVSEHPMKMWQHDPDTGELYALMKAAHHQHLHSRPTQELSETWVQTAGLEMWRTESILRTRTIAGDRIAGFPLEGVSALDINTEREWAEAERIAGYCSGQECPFPAYMLSR